MSTGMFSANYSEFFRILRKKLSTTEENVKFYDACVVRNENVACKTFRGEQRAHLIGSKKIPKTAIIKIL